MTKKSRRFSEKTHKGKSPTKIKKSYWGNDIYRLMKAKRSKNYKKFKFGFIKYIHHLTLEYSQISIGFLWIGRIKCGFKFDVNQYIKSKTIFDTCPSCCPCCGGVSRISSFTHWVISCPKFDEFREQFILFVDDFFINFH